MSVGATLWPLGLMMASAIVGSWAWERRRRVRLNRALHELRRPLQALALGAQLSPSGRQGAPRSLDLALAALADLDGEINGTPAAPALRPVAGRALVAAALERWRGTAAATGHTLEERWRAGRPTLLADPAQVSRALDNLLANALEHGGLRVGVTSSICARGLRIEVASATAPAAGRRWPRSDRRRGHGLRVAAAVAAAHGGRFHVLMRDGTAAAVLELPLAASPIAAAVRLDAGARRGARRAPDRRALAA